MKTLVSAPEVIARFIQIPMGQENRLQIQITQTLIFPHRPVVNSADEMVANAKH